MVAPDTMGEPIKPVFENDFQCELIHNLERIANMLEPIAELTKLALVKINEELNKEDK